MLRSFLPLALLWGASLFALPTGETIIHGNVCVSRQEEQMTIEQSGIRGVVEWKDFQVGLKEQVIFKQAPTASILNRIIGGETSHILGKISSEGQMFLINPQGFVFGTASVIEAAGGFLASTADVSNQSYLLGESMVFHDSGEGEILHLGKISSSKGDIVLISRTIRSRGSINAPNGSVSCVQAHEMVLHPESRQPILIRPSSSPQEGMIELTGEVTGAHVSLQSESPYVYAIRHTKKIEAQGTSEEKGTLSIAAKQGGIQGDGPLLAKGGKIELNAEGVYLSYRCSLDASSEEGGGEIYVHGGEKQIHVHPQAQLLANGIGHSDGGNISVVAENDLQFLGKAEAQGGDQGGNGGFIELSSHGEKFHLENSENLVDVSAPLGNPGRVFFDPKFVWIASGGTDSPTGNTFYFNSGGTSTIDGATLASAINSGMVTLQANTDIYWDDAVSATTAGNGVTLQAGRSIVFSSIGSLNLTQGNFSATINDYGAYTQDRDEGIGQFEMQDFSCVDTGGGNFKVTVGSFGGEQIGWSSLSGNINAQGGDISVQAIASNINRISALTLGSEAHIQTAGAGTITLTGIGGSGEDLNNGLLLGGYIEAEAGTITLIGTGGSGTGKGNSGISSTATIRTTTGDILLNGKGATGTSGNHGIVLSTYYDNLIETADGTISLTGVAYGTEDNNYGISCGQGTQILSSGLGNILMNGRSESGENRNAGVLLSGAHVESSSMPINISGVCQGTGQLNWGVRLEGDTTVISTNDAPIQIFGQGMGLQEANVGVILSGQGTVVQSDNGNMTIEGHSSGMGTHDQGVRLEDGKIHSTGTGEITITGMGGFGRSYCNGISIVGEGAITSHDGDVIASGTGNGEGIVNQGILNPQLITTTGSGAIQLNSN